MGKSQAYWFVENHIIYVDNASDVTAEDFADVDAQMIDMLRQAAENGVETTHVLIDGTSIEKLPSMFDVKGGRIFKHMKEPNYGITVVAGNRTNYAMRILAQILNSVSRANLHLTDSLDDALDYLQRIDDIPELPELKDWQDRHLP